MAFNRLCFAVELHDAQSVSKRSHHLLRLLLACCILMFSGCANSPTGIIQTQERQTLRGLPVKITSISVPSNIYTNVQVAAGSIWATHGSVSGFHKTIRIDSETYKVTMLPRPWTAGFADLQVGEDSIWFSDGMTKLTGRGDLHRVDIETNQVTATIEAVGSPFALGDGAVWAYNPQTRIVTGIDTTNNLVLAQPVLVRQGSRYHESFTFGDGSLWQLTYNEEVSSTQLAGGYVPPGIVNRIDPQTSKVVAAIPLGPYRPSDQIRYAGGSIWVLGERDTGGKPFATRIDVKTNLVVASIPLVRSLENACAAHSAPKTPVFWKGGLWIATFCTAIGRVPYVLVKIDLETNQVTDEFRLPVNGGTPDDLRITAGEDALWGVDGHSALRFDF